MELRQETGAGDMSVPNGLSISPTQSPACRHGARPAPFGKGSRYSRARLRRLTALTECRRPGEGLGKRLRLGGNVSRSHNNACGTIGVGTHKSLFAAYQYLKPHLAYATRADMVAPTL